MKKLILILLSGLLLCVFAQPLVAGAAADEVSPPAGAALKAKCPKKAAVTLETVKTENFFEYHYYPLQAQPGIVAVKSPANGLLAEARIGEGSLVFAGQEMLAIEPISVKELQNLEADAAGKKKIWTARLGWKEKSPKAIQAAEKSYKEALALLEEKKAASRQTVISPATGYVHFIQDLGSSVVVDAVLLEITNPGRMIYTLARGGAAGDAFVVGRKFDGSAENFLGQAEVIAVSQEQVIFAVDNAAGLLKENAAFFVRTLKTEHANAIVVPLQSVFHDSLGDFVYAADKNKAKKIYVTRGASESGRVLVTSGLTAGMTLIVSGFDCLADGKKLRIVKAEETAEEGTAEKYEEEKTAAAQLRGIEEFIAHLEANKATLQYEHYERTKMKRLPTLKVYSGLETQKKLIALITEYAVEQITFKIKDEQVISTIQFKAPAKVAVKAEKPLVGEKVRLFGNRLRIAVHGTYYMMSDQNFKDTYVGLSGFGGSIAFQFARKMDFWLSGGMAAKNNQPAWSPVELKFRLTPLSAAVRYYLLEKGKVSVFAGAGANVFLVKDENPIENIKTTMIGFNVLAGGYYQFSKNVFAQLYGKFNMAKKDLYPDSDLDNPLNLGGMELNLGIGIRL